MGRTKSPMALKTEKARKYDAMRIKDNLRRIDAATSMFGRPESNLSQLPVGAMFMFGNSTVVTREREMNELRDIEERIAHGLNTNVTILRIYPQVLVKRPEQVRKLSYHITLDDIERLVEYYQEKGYFTD